MLHNYLAGRRLRAFGWMLLVLVGLYRGTIPALVLSEYMFIISSPFKTVWLVTFIGMLIQLAVWWYAYHRYRKTYGIYGWRTAVIAVCLSLMLLPMYFFLLAGFWCALILMLILGLVWFKDRTRGEKTGWHTVTNAAFYMSLLIVAVMSFTYTTNTTQYRKLESENRAHLAKVGYRPYPNLDAHSAVTMTRVDGFTGETGGQLNIGFCTGDDESKVFAFYRKRAEECGLTVRQGTYNSGKCPVLVAMGDDGCAIVVERVIGDRWGVVVYWDAPDWFIDDLQKQS